MKRQVCSKPWFLGLLSVILLTTSNITLLMKVNTPTPLPDYLDTHNTTTICKYEDTPRVGRLDQNRQHIIFDSLFVGDNFWQLSQEKIVCLATLSTPDKLHWLPQVVTHWGGLVSLAIYLKDSEEQLFKSYLNYLYVCHSEIMANVSVHLIKPLVRHGDIYSRVSSYLSSEPPIIQCSNPTTVMKAFMKFRAKTVANKGVPQNHMRNVARKGCGTSYVITSDIDVIPSKNAEGQLETFLKRKESRECIKCVFVLPTFELDDQAIFPKSKSELLTLESKGRARPFHEKVFIHNQYATNFSRWRSSNTTNDIVISHPVTDFEFFYEPFYVSLDVVPPHDERFIGYGFTRNTQVYEMFLSGWKFYVLSPIFLIHWGLQRRSTRPGWRENENTKNRILFTNFKRELIARYKLDMKV
ncbi:beta-1,4-glucuronyltransferase 1-like isoform X2 [Artemia franciscana]|uniref:Beta-1,4-glucuronyltransferase 1 n=1 Tax=Artemia franciscana TaxID=6661 RepID=A0AA88HY25_ARTSF|nr:hypothetical protein QYM36_006664 [Artemia franciscana]